MHDSPWKKVLVVNIITMIIGFQGLDNKTPLAIYIQYAITREKSPRYVHTVQLYVGKGK